FEEALPLYGKIGAVLGEANCIRSLGEIHFIESRNDDAKRCFEEALPLYGKIGDVLGEANCIFCIALILIKENQLKKGKTRLEKALSLYEKINSTYSIAHAYYQFARLLKEHPGRNQEAEEMARKAAGLFKELKLPRYAEWCEGLYVTKK
ncbi:MAG: hypothetical protein GY757_09805, partial [bacterium]|nr:hypothetical protein [bacterium]